ncbi:DUF309 domain-containing protein [Halococcus salsus]|uniref:DUF309 domain-containing protein n=1 Tax=Halococcus salsus TaxID=2162894 RepID=UPI001359276F|nr:DUF309 domain-containing protein [Halococcus salsus]
MTRPASTDDPAADPVVPALRAGIAVYNSGRYHAAHDAWEECWLDRTGDDERLLHGLIQLTAAVHHATQGNRAGATGLAESAHEYLEALPEAYRDVNVDDVRGFLVRFAADPDLDHTPPVELTHRGTTLHVTALDFEASAVVARALAEADGFDVEQLDRAIDYAETDLDDGRETSPFVTLVYDLAREENRGIIYQRLAEHTRRRRARDESVDGLFELR